MKINKVVYNYSYTTEWKVDKSNKCIICYNELNDCCNSCTQPIECKPLILKCKHIFHKHCIQDFKKKEEKEVTLNQFTNEYELKIPLCPLCRKTIEIDNCPFNDDRDSEFKLFFDNILNEEDQNQAKFLESD